VSGARGGGGVARRRGGRLSGVHVGIFGGTFDPPHVGHLLLALDAVEQLGLDELRVIPTARQPLKAGHGASPAHRLAMAEACFGGLPRITVDPIEIDRGGLSYTVDTVGAFRARWPDAEFSLLLGEDVAAGLDAWREPARLLAMARLVVVTRAAGPSAVGRGGTTTADQAATPWAVWPGILPPRTLAVRRVDVSATEIRERAARGLPIRGFVPESVAALVAATGEYQSRN
jgi:nicotinate-nucleotide adenylyltransferase